MKIINTINNTNPLILHAQGNSSDTPAWKDIADKETASSVKGLSEDITIVVFASSETSDFITLEQLKNNNIPYLNCVYGLKAFWKNSYKIPYFNKALEGIQTKYVLSLDASDVLLSEDLSDLLPRFSTMDCKALFGATKTCYPPSIKRDIEIVKNSRYRYLNAGTLLGETEFLKTYYKYLVENEYPKSFGKYDNSEQARIRNSWAQFRPDIKADYNCEIFQTLGLTDFDYEDGIVSIIAGNAGNAETLHELYRNVDDWFDNLKPGVKLALGLLFQQVKYNWTTPEIVRELVETFPVYRSIEPEIDSLKKLINKLMNITADKKLENPPHRVIINKKA